VLGRARLLWRGARLAVITTGELANEALAAHATLSKSHIEPVVYQMHTVKPLDTATLDALADEHWALIVVEEHVPSGGLWAAVADWNACRDRPCTIRRLGAPDRFALGNLSQRELRRRWGFDAEAIAAAVAAGRSQDELTDYCRAFRESWLYEELHKARNFKPWMSKGLWLGSLMFGIDQQVFGGKAPWTLRLTAGGAVATLTVPPGLLERLGLGNEYLEGVINFARGIRGVEVSAQLRVNDEGQIRVSLRSRGRVDVAALARAHSDDKGSGVRGGDLGWVSPGMLVPEFEQELGALQPNQVSAPFKTQFGWHIVQALDRRQGQASPETEQARVREALFRRRSDEEWEQWLRRLRDEAYVEIRLPRSPEAASTSVEP
jgi:hypothetical protein